MNKVKSRNECRIVGYYPTQPFKDYDVNDSLTSKNTHFEYKSEFLKTVNRLKKSQELTRNLFNKFEESCEFKTVHSCADFEKPTVPMRKPGAYTAVYSTRREFNIDSDKLLTGFQNLGHATKPLQIDFAKQNSRD